jgi:hypothetical protein
MSGSLKALILRECDIEGAVISEVSGRYGIKAQKIYEWRHQRKRVSSDMVLAEIIPNISPQHFVEASVSPASSPFTLRGATLRYAGCVISLRGDRSFSVVQKLLEVLS